MNLWDPWVTWACKAKVHLCKFERCRIHPKGNLMVPCTTKYLYITISITKPYFFFAIYKWKYYHVEKYYHVASVPPLIRINNLVSLGWKVAVMWCVSRSQERRVDLEYLASDSFDSQVFDGISPATFGKTICRWQGLSLQRRAGLRKSIRAFLKNINSLFEEFMSILKMLIFNYI